jgi:hypothetical protein
MPKITNGNSRKTLGDSVLLFSDLDSARPNYKNSPIFIKGQKKSLNLFSGAIRHKHN